MVYSDYELVRRDRTCNGGNDRGITDVLDVSSCANACAETTASTYFAFNENSNVKCWCENPNLGCVQDNVQNWDLYKLN